MATNLIDVFIDLSREEAESSEEYKNLADTVEALGAPRQVVNMIKRAAGDEDRHSRNFEWIARFVQGLSRERETDE